MSRSKSLTALANDWPEFTRLAKSRMVKGIPIYGDATFNKPLDSILVDVEEELLDWANYSFMAWCRVRGIRNVIRAKLKEMNKCQSPSMTSSTAPKKARPRRP